MTSLDFVERSLGKKVNECINVNGKSISFFKIKGFILNNLEYTSMKRKPSKKKNCNHAYRLKPRLTRMRVNSHESLRQLSWTIINFNLAKLNEKQSRRELVKSDAY